MYFRPEFSPQLTVRAVVDACAIILSKLILIHGMFITQGCRSSVSRVSR